MHWTWAAARQRGTSHERTGTRLQDAYYCASIRAQPQFLVAVTSDGAGTAPFGGQGASIVCRTFSTRARAYLSEHKSFPADATIQAWLADARSMIGEAAAWRGVTPRDFAATLLFLVSDGASTLVAHVGDGAAVALEKDSAKWIALTWPETGEYASTTFFVTDVPSPSLRISRHDVSVSGLALFTDGLERLALQLAAREPFAPFLNSIIAPVAASPLLERDSALSAMLQAYLRSPAITARTDDDTTIVLAVPR